MCLAIPGKVVETFSQEGMLMARVQFGGVTRDACLNSCPETQVGDYVLVHVGFAISRVKEEARRTYEALAELDQLGELDIPKYGANRRRRMKYLDKYRDGDIAAKLVERIKRVRAYQTLGHHGSLRRPDSRHPQLGMDEMLPTGISWSTVPAVQSASRPWR